jgi:enoyl-CoA hydratase/carnithine racemase
MYPRKSKSVGERSSAFSVERLSNITVLRFHALDMLAWSELSLARGLWDFFETEVRDPSPVVLMLAPPGLLDRQSLERLMRGSSDEDTRTDSELRGRIVRQENIIYRIIGDIRRLDSFVVGGICGEVALRAAAPFFACDYHIASSDSAFVNTMQDLPFAPLGCLPWLLTRMVGGAKTMQLLLEVPRLSAADAHDLGLVNHVTAPDRFEEEALEVAKRLAALPRLTLVLLKRSIIASCEDLPTYQEREQNWTRRYGGLHGKEA